MTEYALRTATPGDAEEIAAAHIDSIRSLGPACYPPEIVTAWSAGIDPEMYVTAINRGRIYVAVACRATESTVGIVRALETVFVLGFSSHGMRDGQHRTAVYMRGSAARRGIGSALFRLAEDDARRAGATAIDVDASLVGVEFYRSLGFAEVGRGEHTLPTGQRMPCVFMRKHLCGAGVGANY